jgi:hypothetical protein
MNSEPEPPNDLGDDELAGGEWADDSHRPLETAADTLSVLNESSCDLWLELLADDELNSVQRNQLLGYLEQHPEYWRACALAFWDRQCLARALGPAVAAERASNKADRPLVGIPAEDGEANFPQDGSDTSTGEWNGMATVGLGAIGVKPIADAGETGPSQRRGTRVPVGWRSRLGWVVTAALGLVTVTLVTLGAREWRTWRGAEATRVELTERLAQTQNYVEELQQELVAERTVFRTLRSVFPDQPCLIEIESTEDRVVYLTDGRVSEDLVRGLLSLGQVEVRPFRPLVETSLWRSMVRPVVAIEVAKDSAQVFPGEM